MNTLRSTKILARTNPLLCMGHCDDYHVSISLFEMKLPSGIASFMKYKIIGEVTI